MAQKEDSPDQTSGASASINLKVTEEERWAFKAWCAQNRMTQVEAFRKAFDLLKYQGLEKIDDAKK
jgi:hypothetical protein